VEPPPDCLLEDRHYLVSQDTQALLYLIGGYQAARVELGKDAVDTQFRGGGNAYWRMGLWQGVRLTITFSNW
jgi:hypothetical protein